MNAPKKIWFDKDYLTVGFEPIDDRDIPYIREDVVLELVEALKICLAGNGYDFDERPAEAALKKLEESHD